MTHESNDIVDDVPVELWSEIIHLLDPRDILSLSHVCRALHGQISRREVWEPIFRSFCRERALFIPSYGNVDDMDLLELIRAALGPHRWNRLLTAHHASLGQQDEESSSQRSLEPLSSATFAPLNDLLVDRFLVPGGRYLVVWSLEALYLFDLGQVGQMPPENPILVAKEGFQTKVFAHDVLCEVVGVKDDETRLRIGVVFSGSPWDSDEVMIYDIVPSHPNVAFTKLSSLVLTSGEEGWKSVRGAHLHCDCIYIRYQRTGIIWDFIQGRYCVVPACAPLKGEYLATLFLGNLVVHIHRQSVLVWKVPPKDQVLHGSRTILAPVLNAVDPDFSLPLPRVALHRTDLPDEETEARVLTPSSWLQNRQPDWMDFDLFISPFLSDDYSHESRFRLKVVNHPHIIQLYRLKCPTLYTSFMIRHMESLAGSPTETILALESKRDGTWNYTYIEPANGISGENLPAPESESRTTVLQVVDSGTPRLERFALVCVASGRSVFTSTPTTQGPRPVRVAYYYSH